MTLVYVTPTMSSLMVFYKCSRAELTAASVLASCMKEFRDRNPIIIFPSDQHLVARLEASKLAVGYLDKPYDGTTTRNMQDFHQL
jgi:hypothetical protein